MTMTGSYIFPPEKFLATLAVNVGNLVGSSAQQALFNSTNHNIHTILPPSQSLNSRQKSSKAEKLSLGDGILNVSADYFVTYTF